MAKKKKKKTGGGGTSLLQTKVQRINMSTAPNVGKAIVSACNAMALIGFRLASTFTQADQLVLIFQKTPF
jgi:hypothetical protein